MKMKTITAARLREMVSYDPATGVFRWLRARSCGVKAGDIAGGKLNENGYHRFRVDGRLYVAHRLAWLYVYGQWPKGEVDHVNGERADNRIANLRDVDDTMNAQNTHGARRDNRVGLAGVGKRKTGRYYARIRTAGTLTFIGRFDTAEDAHAAYVAEKRRRHAGFVPAAECALTAG